MLTKVHLTTSLIVFLRSNRKCVREQANWNSHSSTTCWQEWEFLAAISGSFLASFPAARVCISTPFSAQCPGKLALDADPLREVQSPGEHARPALCFWKWVFREGQYCPRKSRASQQCTACLPEMQHYIFWNLVVTVRLEIISECHLTLKSPLTVCWSKPQFHSSDKHKFWNTFSTPSYFCVCMCGEIYTHILIAMQKRRKIGRQDETCLMWV